jgi:hypothetical protein
MFSRMFFAVVGLGAGVAVGVWAIRKLERTSQQLAPDALVARAGERASGLGARLAEAVEAGRQAAGSKEAELRSAYLESEGEGERQRAGGWGSKGEGERQRAGGWGSKGDGDAVD